MASRVGWGKWNVYSILENISILGKVTQVSDVAHGPLVIKVYRISLWISSSLKLIEPQMFKFAWEHPGLVQTNIS
jgi:hypothetical protein